MYARPSKISGFFKDHLQFVRDVHTPFVWGFTGRVQTLLRPLFNTVSKLIYEEEVITVPDGGEMKLSWYADQHRNDSCPIAIVLPGLAGCACNHYVVTLVKGIAKQGYRCVVVNNRGTCRQKLKTPRAYCASNTEDLSEAISAIQNRYPEAPLSGIGISLGALTLFNYLSCFGEDAISEPSAVHVGKMKRVAGKPCPLRAGMCISMPWDICESTRSLEGSINWLLFNRPLTSSLCKLVDRNADVLSKKYDIPKILKSRSLREFDTNITAAMFGFSSAEDYYKQSSPAFKLDTIKVPLLCFAAADDPFVPLSSIPLNAISQSSHVVLVLTKRGGHIGFLNGLSPKGTNLMDRAAAEFCFAVFENLDELSAAEQDWAVSAATA
ncbi:Phospholipase abhd3 [Sparganum proliferum]